MLTRAVLEQIGYQVLEAANGAEAERAWSDHQGQVDLLVTDLVMPGGVDGRELAARLQSTKPQPQSHLHQWLQRGNRRS
jgi:CheY-like chemotaxis protein